MQTMKLTHIRLARVVEWSGFSTGTITCKADISHKKQLNTRTRLNTAKGKLQSLPNAVNHPRICILLRTMSGDFLSSQPSTSTIPPLQQPQSDPYFSLPKFPHSPLTRLFKLLNLLLCCLMSIPSIFNVPTTSLKHSSPCHNASQFD